jgi:hypothetical protein
MHVSDVLVECAQECARLSRECRDKKIGLALFEVSARLYSAAVHDAELIVDDTQAALRPAPRAGAVAGE